MQVLLPLDVLIILTHSHCLQPREPDTYQLFLGRRRQQALQRRVQFLHFAGHHHDAGAARAVAELQDNAIVHAGVDPDEDLPGEVGVVAPREGGGGRAQVTEALLDKHVVRELLVLDEHGPLDGRGVLVHAVLLVELLLDGPPVVGEARALPIAQLQHLHALPGRLPRVILDVADAPERHRPQVRGVAAAAALLAAHGAVHDLARLREVRREGHGGSRRSFLAGEAVRERLGRLAAMAPRPRGGEGAGLWGEP
mmetsp:Transcript_31308/g.84955  ORF Transcript_31308/g.84955 Transcript_31308/m.84955 type:complete len:253 (+) Transcript_31308:1259-2017(+)